MNLYFEWPVEGFISLTVRIFRFEEVQFSWGFGSRWIGIEKQNRVVDPNIVGTEI